MTIEKDPILDENARSITVGNNIDSTEDVSILLNGLLAIYNDDIENITDNVITIVRNLDIDWTIDTFSVIYTSL